MFALHPTPHTLFAAGWPFHLPPFATALSHTAARHVLGAGIMRRVVGGQHRLSGFSSPTHQHSLRVGYRHQSHLPPGLPGLPLRLLTTHTIHTKPHTGFRPPIIPFRSPPRPPRFAAFAQRSATIAAQRYAFSAADQPAFAIIFTITFRSLPSASGLANPGFRFHHFSSRVTFAAICCITPGLIQHYSGQAADIRHFMFAGLFRDWRSRSSPFTSPLLQDFYLWLWVWASIIAHHLLHAGASGRHV